ncbi:DUF1642 domain-containing protein [Listeria monocytogenes]|uniref:DUF1642 domain-containing protein n=1 Tax=Listeria monocytogenes TaxID=1639 RepID=UPI000AAF03CD|nr:DUF1642 domain-containing protein [Listeria monocytogenes]
MRVYHTETQEDFNALMEKLEREGCMWRNGDSPLEYNSSWNYFCKNTVVYDRNKKITIGSINSVQGVVSIEKYSKSNNSKFPVVPQFVADWYEDNKENLEYKIWEYIYDWDDQDCESDFHDFMYDDNLKPIETLIKMQYGYEVEKEQLYYVKLIDSAIGYLNMRYDGLMRTNGKDQDDEYKTQFTEAEIKSMKKGKGYWLLREPVEEVTE